MHRHCSIGHFRLEKQSLFAVVIGVQLGTLTTLAEAEPANQPHTPPAAVSGLLFNQDESDFFSSHDAATVNGDDIDALIDFYADAGVKTFICGVNAQRTAYDSAVWESHWDDYDPEGPDDQRRLRGILAEEMQSYRTMLDAKVALDRQGVDYPERVLKRCRARGMAGWLSVRMNDAHGLESERSPWPSRFVLENPQLSRVRYQFFFRADRALDYAFPEVRERYRALVEELLTRYDMDGIELDFCRQPMLFGIGRELVGSALLTDWVGEIHDMMEAAAERRGHPIRLGIRVPSEPETSRNLGLDVMTWVESSWIDLVVMSSGGISMSTCTNMPVRLWRQLLRPYGVSLAGCVEPSAASCNPASMVGSQGQSVDPALAVGAAAEILHGGADAVYLFNFFRSALIHQPGWTDESIGATFTAMNSIPTLEPLHRRHIVTLRSTVAPGELVARPPIGRPGESVFVDASLPAKGKYASFRLQTGPQPVGRKVQVVLGMHECRQSQISIRVNGVPGSLAEREQEGDRLRFDVPPDALADEAHVIEVYANLIGGPPFTITWVEIDIAGASS